MSSTVPALAAAAPLTGSELFYAVQSNGDVRVSASQIQAFASGGVQGGIPATSNLTFWVSTTGSDSNPGTLAQPFATIQHAINTAALFNYENQFTPTINVENGTYVHTAAAPIAQLPPMIGIGQNFANIVGNTSTPSNVIVQHINTQQDAFSAAFSGARWSITGIRTDVAFNASSIKALNGAAISFGFWEFQDSLGGGNTICITAQAGGVVQWNTSMSLIASSFAQFVSCQQFSVVDIIFGTSITFPVATTFTHQFFNGFSYGIIEFARNTIVNAGGVTGNRLNLSSGYVLTTDNGQLSDVPGSATGFADATVEWSAAGAGTNFFANQHSGVPTTTQIPSGLYGVYHDTLGDGTYLAYNDAGTIVQSQLLAPVTANLDFYVATTGSDTNPGTIGSPFLTLQHAWDVATLYNYQSQFTFTIHIADGTYAVGGGASVLFAAETKEVAHIPTITGNTTTPTNVILTSVAGGGPGIDFAGREQDGLKIQGVQVNPGNGFYAFRTVGGEMQLSNVAIGGNSVSCFGNYGGAMFIGGTVDLTPLAGKTVGDIFDVIALPGTGQIQVSSCTIKFPASFTISGYFVLAQEYAIVQLLSMTYTNGASFTATTAGAKLIQYTMLQTDNGLASDLPGTVTTIISDNTCQLLNSGTTVFGMGQRVKSGLPATTDLLPQTWGVFKDTSGGGVYVAANDGGTIKKVALT